MRKKLAWGLAFLLVLMNGCSAASAAQLPLSFRTALLQADGCSFTAEMTADYGDWTVQTTLACDFSPDTGAQVTVLAPETIAGITAQVSGSAASVAYDDTQLGLGSLAAGNLAPLAVGYVLGQSWAGAYIDVTGTEDGLLRTTYRMGYDKQELVVDTWFAEDTLTPVRAEISYDGQTVIQAALSDFLLHSPKESA